MTRQEDAKYSYAMSAMISSQSNPATPSPKSFSRNRTTQHAYALMTLMMKTLTLSLDIQLLMTTLLLLMAILTKPFWRQLLKTRSRPRPAYTKSLSKVRSRTSIFHHPSSVYPLLRKRGVPPATAPRPLLKNSSSCCLTCANTLMTVVLHTQGAQASTSSKRQRHRSCLIVRLTKQMMK